MRERARAREREGGREWEEGREREREINTSSPGQLLYYTFHAVRHSIERERQRERERVD